MANNIQFDEWMKVLECCATGDIRDFYYSEFGGFNADAWRDYYDHSYTPEQALAEDLSYADA